uniref:Uncharacterized protein n=1 Tax=Fervidicoccus fontis TaxID=683846 RepID=A0A7J3ZLH1_9CREN
MKELLSSGRSKIVISGSAERLSELFSQIASKNYSGLVYLTVFSSYYLIDARLAILEGFVVSLTIFIKEHAIHGSKALVVLQYLEPLDSNVDFWAELFPMSYEDVLLEISCASEALLVEPVSVGELARLLGLKIH